MSAPDFTKVALDLGPTGPGPARDVWNTPEGLTVQTAYGPEAVEGLDFKRPSWERAAAMARSLHRRGVLAKLRRSAGQDVDGGCGQLRARSQPVRLHRAAA